MQVVQSTPRRLVIKVVYEQRRRPGPAKQVPGNDGALLMVASHAAIALLGGFAPALFTECPHRAGAPQRETVMSMVQPTPTVLVTETVAVCKKCRRPGPAKQVPGAHGAGVVGSCHADTALLGGHALAPREQATGIWRSSTTAAPDYMSGSCDVIVDAATSRPRTRPSLGTKRDRRLIAAQNIHAQRMHAHRMHAEAIPARRIQAHCQLGERTTPGELSTVRPTSMARATHASGQLAPGRPRRSVGRQCGYVIISPAGTSDVRSAAKGFSLRYPRGN